MKRILFVLAFLSAALTSYSQVCTGPLSVTIDGSSSNQPLDASGTATQPQCNALSGLLTGSIELIVSGGTPAYSYVWTMDSAPFSSDQNIYDLGAGEYAVTITDQNNCTAELTFTIIEPTPVDVTGVPFDLSCNALSGPADGAINISPSGGQGSVPGDYTYNWATSDGSGLAATDQNQSGLSAGTYDVTVTDANGCTATESFTLTEPTPVTVVGVTVDLSCNASSGPADGEISITPGGGQGSVPADYTYSWTTSDGTGLNATAQNQTGLSAGTYNVTVTDANGCTAATSFTLTEPTPVQVLASVTNLSCHANSGAADGEITITPGGGQGVNPADYTYSWTTIGGSGLNATAQNQSGLSAGTYNLTVTDANGCTVEASYDITSPTEVTVVGTTIDLSCNAASGTADGAINITPGGGQGTVATDYTYAWSTSDGSGLAATDQNQTGLSAGTYTVTVTDANGCTDTESFTLTEPVPVDVVGTTVDLSCNAASGTADGAINITPSGGQGSVPGDYTYAWSTSDGSGLSASSQNQTGLSAGTYTVTVTDVNGCTDTESFTLTEPVPVDVVGTTVDLSCNAASGTADGAINITPSGGQGSVPGDYTYAWSTSDGSGLSASSQNQTGLSAGTYTVTVTDTNGCTDTETFTLTEPTPVDVVGTTVDLSCNDASGAADGQITITPSGGQGSTGSDYTYAWSTSDGSGLIPTNQNQVGLSAGTYTVIVTDANGCTDTESFTLTEPVPVDVVGTTVDLSCNDASGAADGQITITPSGGQGTVGSDYTYAWSTSDGSGLAATDQNQTGLSAGTYTVIVTDANGCTDTESFTLTEPTPVTCTADSPILGNCGTNIACNGGTGTINVTAGGGNGPYTYSIDGTNFQASNSFTVGAGSYTVTTMDANGCTSTCLVTLTEPTAIVAGTCVENDECQVSAGEIEVEATGGCAPYTVTWTSPSGGSLNEVSQVIATDGDSVIFTGAEGGQSYTFTITDSNGCVIGG